MDFALQEGEVGITEYPLRGAIFSNTYSLSLFFVSPLRSLPDTRKLRINFLLGSIS